MLLESELLEELRELELMEEKNEPLKKGLLRLMRHRPESGKKRR